jgi:hypothetical protein
MLPSRRQLLAGISVTLAVSANASTPAQAKSAAGDWSSPGLATPEDDEQPRFFKTASGVKVQQLTAGSGPEAKPGDAILLDFVLRRANGYFIYSKYNCVLGDNTRMDETVGQLLWSMPYQQLGACLARHYAMASPRSILQGMALCTLDFAPCCIPACHQAQASQAPSKSSGKPSDLGLRLLAVTELVSW